MSKKANTSHTHTVSDVTDFPTLATVATSGSYNDLSNKPTTMTPTSHTHGNITNDGKIGSNANKPLITTTGGTVTTGSFGTSANTFCEGNDSRLSDARTPTAHTHLIHIQLVMLQIFLIYLQLLLQEVIMTSQINLQFQLSIMQL